jgi:hypothetical protein
MSEVLDWKMLNEHIWRDFDGEGCVSVSYTHYRREGYERQYDDCKVHFAISNMEVSVLRDVRVWIGKGGIYHQKRVSSFRSGKPIDILKIIEAIKPYVRIKQQRLENLENAIKFILNVRGTSKKHRWTEEEKKQFKEFAKTSKDLRGSGKRGRPRKYPL